jgi:hypothetical protein
LSGRLAEQRHHFLDSVGHRELAGSREHLDNEMSILGAAGYRVRIALVAWAGEGSSQQLALRRIASREIQTLDLFVGGAPHILHLTIPHNFG